MVSPHLTFAFASTPMLLLNINMMLMITNAENGCQAILCVTIGTVLNLNVDGNANVTSDLLSLSLLNCSIALHLQDFPRDPKTLFEPQRAMTVQIIPIPKLHIIL